MQWNVERIAGPATLSPSTTSPFFGMLFGKPARKNCIHLRVDGGCRLFSDPRPQEFCVAFSPKKYVCGDTSNQARQLLSSLEMGMINSTKHFDTSR